MDEIKSLVDETTCIMKTNLEKVIDRDLKINDIESRSEDLLAQSHHFQKTAKKLKCKLYWENKKYLVTIIIIVLLLVGIVTIILITK